MNLSITNKKQALEAIEELKKFINEPEEWPKEGEKGFRLHSSGAISENIFNPIKHESCSKLGFWYKSKQEAINHKLRLESMAKRWKPEEDKKFWWVDMADGQVMSGNWIDEDQTLSGYWLGNIHPTKESAELWKKTYLEAFRDGI